MPALGLLALLLLALAVGCAEQERGPKRPQRPAAQPPARTTPAPLGVARFLERGTSLRTASVRGRLIPIGGSRMVLRGGDASIVVFAPPSFVQGVRAAGLPVAVSGSVRRLDSRQAASLERQLSRLRRAPKPRRAAGRELGNARRRAGDPHLVLRRVSPVRGTPRRLRALENLRPPER